MCLCCLEKIEECAQVPVVNFGDVELIAGYKINFYVQKEQSLI